MVHSLWTFCRPFLSVILEWLRAWNAMTFSFSSPTLCPSWKCSDWRKSSRKSETCQLMSRKRLWCRSFSTRSWYSSTQTWSGASCGCHWRLMSAGSRPSTSELLISNATWTIALTATVRKSCSMRTMFWCMKHLPRGTTRPSPSLWSRSMPELKPKWRWCSSFMSSTQWSTLISSVFSLISSLSRIKSLPKSRSS